MVCTYSTTHNLQNPIQAQMLCKICSILPLLNCQYRIVTTVTLIIIFYISSYTCDSKHESNQILRSFMGKELRARITVLRNWASKRKYFISAFATCVINNTIFGEKIRPGNAQVRGKRTKSVKT